MPHRSLLTPLQILVLGSPWYERLVRRAVALRLKEFPQYAGKVEVVSDPDITPQAQFVFIDPNVPPTAAVHYARRQLEKHDEIPVIGEAPPTAAAMREVARMSYLRAVGPQVRRILKPRLLTVLDEEGADVWLACRTIHCDNVDEMAASIGVSRRTLYRILDRHGFKGPKEILRVQRVVSALPALAAGAGPLPDIAKRSGYGDYARFQRMVRKVTGVTPRQLRHSSYDVMQLPQRVVKAMLRNGGNGNGDK